MTFGSLFAGIGGIDLGLERAGMECRWQVEIEPYAVRVLSKHWPEVKRFEDITKLTGSVLERVDLLAGGFPCQDISEAGKRRGIDGARSGLWFEFARLIGELRPRYVLIENVPGLLVYDAMRRVLGELSRHRYDVVWFSLRAADFGASHLRKRVFIVAYAARVSSGRPRQPGIVASQESAQRVRRYAVVRDCCSDVGNTTSSYESGFGSFAPGPSDPRWNAVLAELPSLAPALEPPVRGMANGVPYWLDRALSNRTKRLGRLGNAVVPQIAEWIGSRILEAEKLR